MSRRARVQVKKKPMSRTEASAQFGRNKARQRRKQWHRRILMAGIAVMAVNVLFGAWWLAYTGRVEKGADALNQSLWNMTADAGFKLEQIHLTGRKNASAADIKQAIGLEKGAPILSVSLKEMKARLEQIPEVKSVAISRQLPGTLQIAIRERAPAAWWQTGGKVQLIDRDGVVLASYRDVERLHLPIVVGADAPQHMTELMALLDTVPSLRTDVRAAIRVGARRWNIQLERDILVMLPQDDPKQAWKRFAQLVEQKALLSKAIRTVDMRMEDRVFILPTEDMRGPTTLTNYTAKEI